MKTDVDDLFNALADPARRAILHRLTFGEAGAVDLARPFAMSQPAISRHLAPLQAAGLVTHRRSGTRRIFRLEPHRLAELDAWLEDFRIAMDANYARLDALLAADPSERTDPDAD